MNGKAMASRDAAYFEALYAADPDPWNFAGSAYEQHKYRLTMAALAGRHFESAFEIGCSIGVLTRKLAPQCGRLLAVDAAPAALAAAQARCGDLPQVAFARLLVPDEWPGGCRFDLIMLSEVLYFLSASDIARVGEQVGASLLPGGVVLMVNYTERIDEPCSGDQAAECFMEATSGRLVPVLQQRRDTFRIDKLQLCGGLRD